MYPTGHGRKATCTESDRRSVNIAVVNRSSIDHRRRHGRGLPPFRYEQWLMGAVFVAVFLGSCRKDGDTTPPQVTILTPAGGSSVQVPGEVLVRAEVKDNENDVQVVVMVSGGNLSGFVPPVATQLEGGSGIVEAVLQFTDERIGSTSATITVRANDGTNDGRAFRDIGVIETPLRRRALFAAHAPPGGPVTVHKADSTGAVTTFFTQAQDAGDVLVSSYHRRLLLIGDISGPVIGIDAETGQSCWTEPNQGGGGSSWFISAFLGPDRRLYVSSRDGAFVGHQPFNGTHELNGFAQPDRTIRCFGMEGGRLVTQEDGIGGPERELVVRSTVTGAALDVQALDFDLVAMHPGTTDHLLLFGNTTSGGRIEDRTLSNGLPVELLTLTGETIGAVATDEQGRFWLLMPGRVASYAPGASATTTLWSGNATDIVHDAADGVVWVAAGATATAIDPNTGATVGSVDFPQSIEHMAVFLNR